MKTNVKKTVTGMANYHGIVAPKLDAEKELEKIVSCLMLFEETFYASGTDIAKHINTLLKKCSIPFVCDLAIRTRHLGKLRHAPLYLMVQALKMKGTPEERNLIGNSISEVIHRADELAEILAIYWKENPNASVPRQLKAGIAKAFPKFNEYNLAKYNQDGDVKLRDAMFISHPKPENKEMDKLWKKLINNKLETPETWETMLSAGKDKKKTWTKLLKEEKIGYLALLKNLRNMMEVSVDMDLIKDAIAKGAKKNMALPYRFITAHRYAPELEDSLSDAMIASVENHPKLIGKTAILVDVSPSMTNLLSGKSEMTRHEAANAMAILCREIADARIFPFSGEVGEIARSTHGLQLANKIMHCVPSNGTLIGRAIKAVVAKCPDLDRLIIITDEQSQDKIPNLPKGMKGYIINVAPYGPALPTYDGVYTRFSGFSENILDWIIGNEVQ